MLEVTRSIQIPDDEFHWSFVRSGGPGGQNVNKVASKAVLRWDLAASPSVPDDVKARLRVQQPSRLTVEGEFVLSSQRYRDQGRNVEDCLLKLREMIVQATHVPKKRRATRPTRGSQERRLDAKRRRSHAKTQRRSSSDE